MQVVLLKQFEWEDGAPSSPDNPLSRGIRARVNYTHFSRSKARRYGFYPLSQDPGLSWHS